MRRPSLRARAFALATLTLALSVSAFPASAKGGEIGGVGNEFFLADTFSAEANIRFVYGLSTDEVYVGDWDGNGSDTLALRRGATFYIRNSNSGGVADQVVTYGRPGDVVLVGDWDGDGDDTFAVRRGAEYHIKNTMSGGAADQRIVYGRSSDDVYVGDFDGDGDDTLAVRRGAEYFISNAIRAGAADRTVIFGRASDTTLVGDWNRDGGDTLGIRRPPPAPAAPDPQPPVFAYGTLRSGQSAHYIVEGRTSWEQLTRMPYMDLYMIPGYTFPWAVPSAREYGAVGELMDFPSASYWDMIARLDRYELYDPALPPDSQRYYHRTQRPTLHAPSAWVFVATQRWQDYARSSGTLITTGDFTRW